MGIILKKIVVGVPLIMFVALVILIFSVNAGSDSSSISHEKTNEAGKDEKLEMSKHNPANPKYYGLQAEQPLYDGSAEGVVTAVTEKWDRLTIEEQYSIAPDSKAYGIIASVVPEVNYINRNFKSGLAPKLDAWQETAHDITSPVTDLSEERKNLIKRFESQMNDLYVLFENRS